MRIRDIIKSDPGFQYVVDSMEFMSSAGRGLFLDTLFSNDPAALTAEYDRIDHINRLLASDASKRHYIDLRHCLMQLHDLRTTLASLQSRTPLNEVELFELKQLASVSRAARRAVEGLGMEGMIAVPDLAVVFALLDPDQTGTPNFYIYDSYDPRLAPLRRELKALQTSEGDAARIAELLALQAEVQQEVCLRLTDELHDHHAALVAALGAMAYADSLLARAAVAREWGLVRPALGDTTRLRGLFNPRLRQRNQELHLRYQPIDIDLRPGVTLITGANMAGKTVLLKSIGIAQTMAQCGMFVPAVEAELRLVEGVVSSIGDEQNEMNGLSSYASEIIKISDILRRCRGEELLVLIDEPARTTNPVEGKALVQALIAMLEPLNSTTLVTTHYGGLGNQCRRLRVRGFVEDMDNVPLTPQSINRFIDYSLAEDDTDEVPHEALRIAAILGCDPDLIERARRALA